jgi:hypothetical protein
MGAITLWAAKRWSFGPDCGGFPFSCDHRSAVITVVVQRNRLGREKCDRLWREKCDRLWREIGVLLRPTKEKSWETNAA